MEESTTRIQITPKLVLGLSILTLGVLFTLDNLDLVDAGNFLDYWPLALVAVGLTKLAQSRGAIGWIGASLWIFAGGWWTAYNIELVDIHVFELWPILLIVCGLSMVRRSLGGSRSEHGGRSASCVAVLSGFRRQIADKDYKGGDFTAVMGGCEIDLTEAEIQGEAVIDVTAIMGGIHMRVPRTFTVESKVTAILGGVEDQTDPSRADPNQRLVITGMAMMGGVEIKH